MDVKKPVRGAARAILIVGAAGGVGSIAAAESTALDTANASLEAGFDRVSDQYADGWDQYLRSLRDPPVSLETRGQRKLYEVSAMVLAASEDKTCRGAFVASPTMPWAFGTGLFNPSANYHAVWSRDMYEIVTALSIDGDVAGGGRALDFLFNVQQKPDGSFPQNTKVDGRPVYGGLQLDEVADPIILAYQLGRKDPTTWRQHVKPAADFLVNFVSSDGYPAPYTPQERWEDQSGYSPSTIASEIASLVCAADIAQANGDAASAELYLATADSWRSQLGKWTVTQNGPCRPLPYYVRLTKDGNANASTAYSLGCGGPIGMDQRAVADAGFLELIRLGIKPASDQVIINSLQVVDEQVGVTTPNGIFWHRYNNDGYGETSTGAPWSLTAPGTLTTHGRLWPFLAGERGEYDLAAHNVLGRRPTFLLFGEPQTRVICSLSRPGIISRLLARQACSCTGTASATPLAWAHAQFIRLAFDIAAGRLLEQPAIVARRYLQHRSGNPGHS